MLTPDAGDNVALSLRQASAVILAALVLAYHRCNEFVFPRGYAWRINEGFEDGDAFAQHLCVRNAKAFGERRIDGMSRAQREAVACVASGATRFRLAQA